MKYKLIGTNDYIVDPITTVLNNRGIKDIDKFLNVNKNDTHNYKLLKNIDIATKLIISHLKNNNRILLNVDSDTDGYTSSALMYNYLKKINKNADIKFHIHNEKIHGIFNKDVNDDINLVIVPDAGSNDYEELEKLNKRGIDVIILDHHNSNKYSEHAVVVNNQMCNYPNKNLSGVGIVYKLCQSLDQVLNVEFADGFLDLVAIGMIGDMMSTKELETRYYILEGLKNINNPFIKALFDKQSYSTKGIINIVNTVFYIVPLINAMIRFGSMEEKCNTFKAMLCDYQYILLDYKKRSGEIVKQSLPVTMARICSNVKNRQDRAKKKSAKLLEKQIKKYQLDKNQVLIVDGTDKLDRSLTGLVAMQIAQKYKKPTLVLQKDKDNFIGSGRNFNDSPLLDFRGYLDQLGLFNFVEGHDSAFGYEIKAENVDQVICRANKDLAKIGSKKDYIVDFKIPVNKLNNNFFKTILNYKYIWGRDVEEPIVLITDIIIDTKSYQLWINKNKNIIKFNRQGLEFIKFKANEDEYLKLKEYPTISIDVIGRVGAYEWRGKQTYQIIIQDYQFSPCEDFSMF